MDVTDGANVSAAAGDGTAMDLILHVNGVDQRVTVRSHHTLLEVLRDRVSLLSVREGCGIGMCGACTVLVDGYPISACLTLAAMAEGHDVVTLEGLSPDGGLDIVQEAFIACSGFQCSYCTPGILLTTSALLRSNPNATDDEIRDHLSGNLCRCGSYVKIMDSVHEAIRRLQTANL